MRLAIALAAALAAVGCTTIDTATLPSDRGGRGLFITQEDLTEPYESLGPIQATRRGVLLFGFVDPARTDLQAGIDDLLPEIRKLGGDGVINLRYHQTQYHPFARVLGALFFFIPLPAEVNVTGEVVRLRRSPEPTSAPGAAPRG
jgi:hypothetical protein